MINDTASTFESLAKSAAKAGAIYDDFLDSMAFGVHLSTPKEWNDHEQDLKEVEVLDVRTEDARPLLGQEPKPEA